MYRCSIIACARWENESIREWLTYYAAIGFDHVYLQCNDDDPTGLWAEVERFLRARPGFVTFKHFPGQGQQRAMYLDVLETARANSKWLTFLDVDEFLTLRGVNDVNAFIASMPDGVESIHFHWLNFGNNGFKSRAKGSVLKSYTRRAATIHPNTKHLTLASRLDPARFDVQPVPFWHVLPDPPWSDLRRVNSLGIAISADESEHFVNDAMIGRGVVNHYMIKSEDDFVRRAERGTAAEFSGQAAWKRHVETGHHRAVMDHLNEVEDCYLAEFAERAAIDGEKILSVDEPAGQPEAPTRHVRVSHRLWSDDLILGSNNRVLQPTHGSLGTYIAADDVLFIKWDCWPSDLFFLQDGVFVPREALGNSLIDMRARHKVAFGHSQADLKGVVVGVQGSAQTVEIRPGTSDVDVFTAIFHGQEYAIDLGGPIETIVDLGANTGLATVFYALRYPGARIIAVEPEISNYQLLCRNTATLSNVHAVNAAIWSQDTSLSLETVDAAGMQVPAWGFQTTATQAGSNAQSVEALSMSTLLARFGIAHVDLLKIDIEGAELELFSDEHPSWLAMTRNIVVETHERFRPGSDAKVTEKLKADFDERPMSGENRIFTRRPRVADPSVLPVGALGFG